MNAFSRILVPVDGSEISEHAVEQAINLAQLSKGTIDFLYVANITSVTGGQQMPGSMSLPESVLETIKEAGNTAMRHMLAKVPADIKVCVHCETGLAADVILDFAEKKNSDIVIMGSRGLTAATGMLLGSVSQRLAEYAKCPVMIVK